MEKMMNLDADESLFFTRELEVVKGKVYDRQYPNLMARTLIPVARDVDPGAESVGYLTYDHVGVAQIIANYAQDLPRADVKGLKNFSNVRGMGDSYGYTIQEIRAAKLAGIPLSTKKADAARRAMAELENRLAFFGDTANGLVGLFNNPNVTEVTIPADGTGSSKLWSTKTPAQIIRDMNLVANAPSELTNNIEKPDTMLLPVSRFNYINSTPRSDQSDMTILKFFLANSAYIKSVQPINEIKGAFAGATEGIFVYSRDPDKLEMVIPQDFEQFDPQPRGLEWVVPCHERFGGVVIYYPLSVAFGKGI